MLLSFITLINAKTWAYELNSNFRNKSEWTLPSMLLYEFRSEQAVSGSRNFKENKIILLKNLFKQYIKNLYLMNDDEQLNFYHISIYYKFIYPS